MAAVVELDDELFSAESYVNRPIPRLDDHVATKLALSFSGGGLELDRSSDADLELLQGARLGKRVRLIIVGEVRTKAYRLRDGELSFSAGVVVEEVEMAELA